MSVKAKYIKGRLKFRSGAVDDESVAASTAPSTGIANYGVTRIKTATSEGTWVIDAPVLGARKKIIISDTTCMVHIKTSPAYMNTTGYDVLTITNAATTMIPEIGASVDLFGASTVLWYMSLSAISLTSGAVASVVLGATT